MRTRDGILVGIDLGTTYSSLSWLDDRSRPQALLDPTGEPILLPSVVFFPADGSPPIVGEQAIAPGCEHPERFVEHAKRYLGSSDKVWEIDGVLYTPVDISAIIVAQLLAIARPKLGTISEAVITVPAHFTGHQRKLTIEAGRQAGLKTVNIVNEPVAAALAYVLGERALESNPNTQALSYIETEEESESTVLVYDLGGGTFDLSIVRHNRNQLRVLAASGEEMLGGIDWDDKLLDIVGEPMRVVCGNIRRDPRALRKARSAIEAAKRRLSDSTETTLKFHFKGEEREFLVTRQEFEDRSRELVARTQRLTEELLASCKLEWDDLECMLPVGGATLMPMIQRTLLGFAQRVKPRFSHTRPFLRHISPHLSIAHGAALFSGIIHAKTPLQGVDNVAGNNVGLIVRNARGERIILPLIKRSEQLPTSVSVTLATKASNQRRASLCVVEGGQGPADAKVLCKCTIDDLPPGLPVDSLFDVTVSYDLDGLLHLIAKHRDTGRLATVSAQYGSM